MPGGHSLAVTAAAIATAMSLQVITATLIGESLPLPAAKLKLDTVMVASPPLTTIVEVTGLLIFLSPSSYSWGFKKRFGIFIVSIYGSGDTPPSFISLSHCQLLRNSV